MHETKTALVALGEDGVLIVRIREGARQSLDDAIENLAAAVATAGDRRRPLLIDIRRAQPLDAAARHHYSGQALIDSFTALALLVDASPFGRMMGNIYLRVARPGIPSRLFTEERPALEWLTPLR